ncbi:MAG: hypothetical protein H0U75_10400 [Legionella sp.]|nr:hypothetical protein [Legionella sp.]
MQDKIGYWEEQILGDPALLSTYPNLINKLSERRYKSAQLKQFKQFPILVARANHTHRLAFVSEEIGGKRFLIAYKEILNHDYDKELRSLSLTSLKAYASSFLPQDPITESDFLALEDIEVKPCAQESKRELLAFENLLFHNKYYLLSEEQQSILHAPLPAIIHGEPGTGKTGVGLKLFLHKALQAAPMATKDKPLRLVWVTKSGFLINKTSECFWANPLTEKLLENPALSIEFLTSEEFFNKTIEEEAAETEPRLDKPRKKTKNPFKHKEPFTAWLLAYQNHHRDCLKAQQEARNFNLFFDEKIIFEEFRLIAGLGKSYLSTPGLNSHFKDTEQRQFVLTAFEVFSQSACAKEIHFFAGSVNREKNWLTLVDETQDLTLEEFLAIDAMALDGQILWLNSYEQRLLDSHSNEKYFDKLSYKNIARYTLKRSFRCPQVLTDLAHHVMGLQAKVLGKTFNLEDAPSINQKPGTLVWKMPKDIPSLVINSHTAIIASEKNLEEVRSLYGDSSMVLSIKDAKGLEFLRVILHDLFDDPLWIQISDILEHNSKQSKKDGNERYNTSFASLITAITRGQKELIFVQKKRAKLEPLFKAIKQGLPRDPKQMVLDEDLNQASTARDWEVKARQFYDEGNRGKASSILLNEAKKSQAETADTVASWDTEYNQRQKNLPQKRTKENTEDFLKRLWNKCTDQDFQALFQHEEFESLLFKTGVDSKSLLQKILEDHKKRGSFFNFLTIHPSFKKELTGRRLCSAAYDESNQAMPPLYWLLNASFLGGLHVLNLDEDFFKEIGREAFFKTYPGHHYSSVFTLFCRLMTRFITFAQLLEANPSLYLGITVEALSQGNLGRISIYYLSRNFEGRLLLEVILERTPLLNHEGLIKAVFNNKLAVEDLCKDSAGLWLLRRLEQLKPGMKYENHSLRLFKQCYDVIEDFLKMPSEQGLRQIFHSHFFQDLLFLFYFTQAPNKEPINFFIAILQNPRCKECLVHFIKKNAVYGLQLTKGLMRTRATMHTLDGNVANSKTSLPYLAEHASDLLNVLIATQAEFVLEEEDVFEDGFFETLYKDGKVELILDLIFKNPRLCINLCQLENKEQVTKDVCLSFLMLRQPKDSLLFSLAQSEEGCSLLLQLMNINTKSMYKLAFNLPVYDFEHIIRSQLNLHPSGQKFMALLKKSKKASLVVNQKEKDYVSDLYEHRFTEDHLEKLFEDPKLELYLFGISIEKDTSTCFIAKIFKDESKVDIFLNFLKRYPEHAKKLTGGVLTLELSVNDIPFYPIWIILNHPKGLYFWYYLNRLAKIIVPEECLFHQLNNGLSLFSSLCNTESHCRLLLELCISKPQFYKKISLAHLLTPVRSFLHQDDYIPLKKLVEHDIGLFFIREIIKNKPEIVDKYFVTVIKEALKKHIQSMCCMPILQAIFDIDCNAKARFLDSETAYPVYLRLSKLFETCFNDLSFERIKELFDTCQATPNVLISLFKLRIHIKSQPLEMTFFQHLLSSPQKFSQFADFLMHKDHLKYAQLIPATILCEEVIQMIEGHVVHLTPLHGLATLGIALFEYIIRINKVFTIQASVFYKTQESPLSLFETLLINGCVSILLNIFEKNTTLFQSMPADLLFKSTDRREDKNSSNVFKLTFSLEGKEVLKKSLERQDILAKFNVFNLTIGHSKKLPVKEWLMYQLVKFPTGHAHILKILGNNSGFINLLFSFLLKYDADSLVFRQLNGCSTGARVLYLFQKHCTNFKEEFYRRLPAGIAYFDVQFPLVAPISDNPHLLLAKSGFFVETGHEKPLDEKKPQSDYSVVHGSSGGKML